MTATAQAARRYEASVSPQGVVTLVIAGHEDVAFGQAGEVPAKLVKQFGRSRFAGLACLVSETCDISLPSSLEFWRHFAERYFRAVRRQPSSGSNEWTDPECPDQDTLAEILASAPPMLGLEYLSHQVLVDLWNGLHDYTREQAAQAKGGLPGYLHKLRRDWNLVGRVTFHLAENKKNAERPFAFLATYSESQSQSGSIKHRPLAEALKGAIDAGDTSQLDTLLAPVSRAAQSSELIEELLQSRALFAPQAWSIQQAYEFLSNVSQLEEAGVIVRVPNWWNAARPPRPQVQVRVGSQAPSMLSGVEALDLEVGITIDGQPLSPEEQASLMAAREGMTLLRGKWVEVNQEKLHSALAQWRQLQQEQATGLGFLEGLRLLSGASLVEEGIDDQLRNWTRLEAGPWLAETLDVLRDPRGKIQLDPQQHLQATLRPYQADGVRWLWFATRLGLGACLADDMGLGKTIQIISLLLQIKDTADQPTNAPSLLIMPTSLLGNWQREMERFGPRLRMLVAHRSMTDPKRLKQIAADPQQKLADLDVVATTYGLARRETWLRNMKWRLLILDEAQAIKNAGAAQTKAIKSIPSQGRIIMTGTPVENHLGDLWSLFDFCSPGLLGTAQEFQKFVKADDSKLLSKRLASLRQLIRPYVLRRMKTDPRIVPDLPAKTEMRVDCGLTPTQATLYRQVVAELEQAIDIATGVQRRGMILSALMQLKQICNHPALYLKQAEFSHDDSGKYSELASISEQLVEKQEKVLVFTQFQSLCRPLARFLQTCFGRSGLCLTGKTTTTARSKMVAQFQEETGPPFFVISVKAGGTGLNLTQASHVVHFDRWWNPAVEDQATDRAFRIGQQRRVLVHKFVCRGTLEERINDMIETKKELSRELFDKDGELPLTEMTNDQLMDFISLDLRKASTR